MLSLMGRILRRAGSMVRIMSAHMIYALHFHEIKGFQIAGNVRVERDVEFYCRKKGTIRIGKGSTICRYSKIVMRGGYWI